jgi:cytochrome c oxidase subunit 1
LNDWVSVWAFIFFSSFLLFGANLIYSWFFKVEPAMANPWASRSLEWQLPYPLPAANFERVPTIVAGPYDYGVPNARPVADFGQPAARPAGGS